MSVRVLIIRAGQLGDTVFASSIIEPLRHLYGEDVVIDWLAKAGMHTLFAADPRIHRVFAIKSRKLSLWLNRTKLAVVITSLHQPYDLVVNLELGTLFNDLMRLVRAKRKIGMPYRHFTEPAETHAVENLHLIYASFMDTDTLTLATPSLQGPEPLEIRQHFDLPEEYLVLVPSNSHHDKSGGINRRAWPIAHRRTLLAQLAQQPTHVVLIGRADESAYLEELMPLPNNVISLIGRTDLATRTSVYAIIGPTNYRRTGPYATPNNTIHILSADCLAAHATTPRVRGNRPNQAVIPILISRHRLFSQSQSKQRREIMSDATQTHSHQGTSAKNIRRSRTQWQRIMQKYETSGLSQPAFCAQEDLAQHLFCKWRKTLISSCRPAMIDDSDKLFVEGPAVDRDTQPVLQWDVELAFANGIVMRLKQG